MRLDDFDQEVIIFSSFDRVMKVKHPKVVTLYSFNEHSGKGLSLKNSLKDALQLSGTIYLRGPLNSWR